jgi:predicted amidophosphoribosyltransferase
VSIKVCPKCGNTLASETDKYCYKDGTEMVETPPCECGRELSRLDAYCPQCGKKLPKGPQIVKEKT